MIKSSIKDCTSKFVSQATELRELVQLDYKIKKPCNARCLTRLNCKKKTAATYSPGITSTIGAAGLNFSVRNGKRWDPCAKAT